MAEPAVVLMDTNAIIEAVRTRCWRAISNRFRVETVEECRDEARRGDAMNPAYVAVSENDLALLAAVHAVKNVDRAPSGATTISGCCVLPTRLRCVRQLLLNAVTA